MKCFACTAVFLVLLIFIPVGKTVSAAENSSTDTVLANYTAAASISGTQTETSIFDKKSTENRFGFRINTVETSLFTAAGHPLGSLAGDINLGSGFAVGPLFAWGPPQPIDAAELGFWAIGLHGTYYFSGRALQDGWFIRAYCDHYTASASISQATSNSAPIGATGSEGIDAIGASIGYQWVWNMGLSITLGLGAVRYNTDTPSVAVSGTDPNSGTTVKTEVDLPQFAGQSLILPMPEISVGWVF